MQQVVKLMTFLQDVVDARRSHGSNWEKNQGRKDIRSGKLHEGTTSVENLRCKEQEE